MLVVKMKNLRKTYGSHIILNDFNLEVEEGEFVAITGSSGSGKLLTVGSIICLAKRHQIIIHMPG